MPSVYGDIPDAWFTIEDCEREDRHFKPPYAFYDTWQEISTSIEELADTAKKPYILMQKWQTEATIWPTPSPHSTYLGTRYDRDTHSQRLITYWNNAHHYDIMDTLDGIPGTSILKAIVQADAYRDYGSRNFLQHSRNIRLDVSLQPVLSDNKPIKKHVSRYTNRENVPIHTIRLPFSSIGYVWTPQRDAFLADYSNNPNTPGSPAEIRTDEFFDIARAIALLMRAENKGFISNSDGDFQPIYTPAV